MQGHVLDVATLASWVHGGNHLPYDLLHSGSNHVYSGNLSSYMCVRSSTWNKTPSEFNNFPRLSRFWRPMLVPTIGVVEATLCWTERQHPYIVYGKVQFASLANPFCCTPFCRSHGHIWSTELPPMSLCSCTIKFLCAHSPHFLVGGGWCSPQDCCIHWESLHPGWEISNYFFLSLNMLNWLNYQDLTGWLISR